MIQKVVIKNFKCFSAFEIELNPKFNIVVGANEVGKSTLLEAIGLALTKRYNGRSIDVELNSYLFNQDAVKACFRELEVGTAASLPTMLIEVYFKPHPSLTSIKGSNNSLRENCPGVRLEIRPSDEYAEELEAFKSTSGHVLLPTEYYEVRWHSFSGNAVPHRGLPVGSTIIDASTIRLQSGTDYYLQEIIGNTLDPKERVALAVAYRTLKESFGGEPSIGAINKRLQDDHGDISSKLISLGIDVSHRAGWESGVVPHLDQVPLQLSGRGEQSRLKILLALQRRSESSQVILIEEPENHLSYSGLTRLIDSIKAKCLTNQVILTTHSAYVLNKLGLDQLILLDGEWTVRLSDLPPTTLQFFEKISGYDTLRLILAKKIVLVEGDSDELFFQRAYLSKHGVLPVAHGIDVLSVGTAFKRFLDIAKRLPESRVVAITDNDGDYLAREAKYTEYDVADNITVCFSRDNALPTLEPHVAACNSLTVLGKVLSRSFASPEQAVKYMTANKVDAALAIFKYEGTDFQYPAYMMEAVNAL